VQITDPTNTTIQYYDNNLAVLRLNANGSIDRSFFGSGMVVTPLLRSHIKAFDYGSVAGKGASVAIQADGKVVVSANGPDADATGDGGTNPDHGRAYLFRYNTDGTPDRSFGDAGAVWAQAADHGSYSGDLGIDSKGRITVAGFSFQSNPSNAYLDTKEFTLLRFTARGRADRTFGNAGIVLGKADGLTGNHTAMAVQKNGTVVAGISRTESINETAAVYRFLPDGTPDTSFGSGGASPRFTGSPVAVLPYRDGRTAVANKHAWANIPHNLLRAARVRADGSADPTFGPDGAGEVQVGLPVHANDVFEDMAVRRSDGKVVVHGSLDYASLPVAGGTLRDQVVAYDDAGRAAITFGPATGYDAYGGPVAIGPDDKVVVGDVSNSGTNNQTGWFGAHRYNPDGTVDHWLAGNGTSTRDLDVTEGGYIDRLAVGPGGRVVALSRRVRGFDDPPPPWTAQLESFFDNTAQSGQATIDGAEQGAVDEFDPIDLAFQADGKIVVLGTQIHRAQADGNAISTQIVVRRYNANLSFNKTFAAPISSAFSRFTGGRSVTAGTDGKITLVGTTGRLPRNNRIVLIRYNPDGTLDTTFNTTGTLVTDLVGTPSNVVVQANGQPVIAANTSDGPVLARFTTAGAPDPRFGDAGVLSTDLGTRSTLTHLDFAPDGKLVAGGTIGHGRRGRIVDLVLLRFEW
jgi:uncharacterized delta-60 repeat protein